MINRLFVFFFSDFPRALKRILTNKVVMFGNLATIFNTIGSGGVGTFSSRIMEVQFNRSAAEGSIIRGPISLLVDLHIASINSFINNIPFNISSHR